MCKDCPYRLIQLNIDLLLAEQCQAQLCGRTPERSGVAHVLLLGGKLRALTNLVFLCNVFKIWHLFICPGLRRLRSLRPPLPPRLAGFTPRGPRPVRFVSHTCAWRAARGTVRRGGPSQEFTVII